MPKPRKLVQFDLERIKQKGEMPHLVLDLFMIIVVILNLSFIVFDWHWQFQFFRSFFESFFNGFYQFYHFTIHPDFLLYDMGFVTIFVTELTLRWVNAIRKNTYHKWFWYPFIHWYDTLGCLPLGSFRFLRLFRVVAILVRLQKLEVIDLRKTYVYTLFIKYYRIFVEEVSDRVVVNVLENMQEEIKEGNPVVEEIVRDVIQPKKEVLVEWVSHRMKMVVEHNYERKRDELKTTLQHFTKEALANNKEVKNITNIPIVGKQITEQLEGAISGVTFNVMDAAIRSLASDDNKLFIEETVDMIFDTILLTEQDRQLNDITIEIVTQSLEKIKDQVKVQKWKEKELKQKQIKERARAMKKVGNRG